MGFGQERLIEANLKDGSALIAGAAEPGAAVPVLRLTYRVGVEGEAQSLQ